MPNQTPTTEALPLCRALAAQDKHCVFAANLQRLLGQISGYKPHTMTYLTGMLAAYLELGLITSNQLSALTEELIAYVYGADA